MDEDAGPLTQEVGSEDDSCALARANRTPYDTGLGGDISEFDDYGGFDHG